MLHEEPAQVTRADTQTSREALNATFFKATLFDQAQRTGNRTGGALPCRASGRALGPAAQARPETRFSCGRRGREVANVFVRHSRHGTTRAAVNPGAENADEKPAVETRVTREARPPESFPVNVHSKGFFRTVQISLIVSRVAANKVAAVKSENVQRLRGAMSANVQLCGPACNSLDGQSAACWRQFGVPHAVHPPMH